MVLGLVAMNWNTDWQITDTNSRQKYRTNVRIFTCLISEIRTAYDLEVYLVFILFLCSSTNSYITVAFNCGFCFSQIWNTARPKSHVVPTGTNCHALHHELKHQDKSAPIEAMDFEHFKCLSHVGSVFKIIYRK